MWDDRYYAVINIKKTFVHFYINIIHTTQEKKTDPKKEIELLVRKKTNEQLSQFSTIYFNKIKKNVEINEL